METLQLSNAQAIDDLDGIASGASPLPGDSIVIVLSLFGDNDLTHPQLQVLQALAGRRRVCTNRVIVVFKGDRHELDCVVQPSYPAVVKTKHLMRHAAQLIVCENKLDRDTLNWVAAFVLHHLANRCPRELALVARLGLILGSLPGWDGTQRLLDLYDGATGYGLLYKKAPSTVRGAASAIASIAPRVLVAKGSGLGEEMVSALWCSQACKVDLSSNRLGLAMVSQVFPRASYLNLGANQLRSESLHRCSPSLKHLYLHKNELRTVEMEAVGGCQLESLSLYRNSISHLEIANQAALEQVNVGANPLTIVPPTLESAPRLRSLGLARTRITKLPEWLMESPTLQQIDLSYIEDGLPVRQVRKLEDRGIEIIKKPASLR